MTRNEIKVRIAQLKQEIRQGNDPINVLENAFAGCHSLVISCGSSMKYWKKIYEREKANNPVVVCIKQSFLEVGNLCDFHFVNHANIMRYKYKNDSSFIVNTRIRDVPVFGQVDLIFNNLTVHDPTYASSLAAIRNFDAYTLRKTGLERPCGPGIMYEAVFHTLHHLGIKKIVTVGWDIADSKGQNIHFYDRSLVSNFEKKLRLKEHIKTLLGPMKLLSFKNKYIYVALKCYWFTKYYLGQKVNPEKMLEGEAQLTAFSVPYLIHWLRSEGIEIEIISDSKWMEVAEKQVVNLDCP